MSLTTATLDTVAGGPGTVVVFKHSPSCSISAGAARDVAQFATEHPEVPVRVIDVIGQRPLSREVAARFGVAHASPQVLVLRHGAVAWSATHFGITTASLSDAVRRAG